MKQPKEKLKTYFETGDKPTEQEFCDLIDSYHHQDSGRIVTNITADTYLNQTKIVFSDGSSVMVPNINANISVNNKIRVVDLGVINPSDRTEREVRLRPQRLPRKGLEEIPVDPSDSAQNTLLENAVIRAINNLEPPLVVQDDENIIFEFDILRPTVGRPIILDPRA